jgi:hypothetical protein
LPRENEELQVKEKAEGKNVNREKKARSVVSFFNVPLF